MDTLEIVRKAYTDACAELEKSQHRCSKLEALLIDILETLPAEFVSDIIDLDFDMSTGKPAIRRLKKYISLALIAQREVVNGNKT